MVSAVRERPRITLGSLEVTTNAIWRGNVRSPLHDARRARRSPTATAADPQGNTSGSPGPSPGHTSKRPHLPVRAAANQTLDFSTKAGDGIAIEDPDAGPLNPDWSLDALGHGGHADAGEYRRFDRIGRRDRIALVRRSAERALDAPLEGMIFNPGCGDFHVLTTFTFDAQANRRAVALQTQFVITDGVFVGGHDGRLRPRLAPPGDPGRQYRARPRRSRSSSPSRASACERSRRLLAPARDHISGGYRRHDAAGVTPARAVDHDRRPGEPRTPTR